MPGADLAQPARGRLSAESFAALAHSEGWEADAYALRFAEALCDPALPLDVQRERLAALVDMSGALGADAASAQEIGRHFAILDALFRRLLVDAAGAATGRGGAEAAERLLNGALKAQRAALACLSALKVLRDTARVGAALQRPGTAPTTAPSPSNGAGAAHVIEAK